ncbi:MAG: amidohydrolase, partial [Alphaproteobacteria bacterium]
MNAVAANLREDRSMPTRRGFVTSMLGAGAALATQGPHKAAAQANRRLIVDAQVHLWKAESPDWKWVSGLQPQLPEPFTIERLVPMMDEAGVDRAVIVPPSWPGDRNDYALEAVKRYPTRFRVMGRIPLQDPKSADLLPKWKEQQGML